MDPRGTRTAAAAYTLVQGALMDLRSSREKIRGAVAALPVLSKAALEREGADLEEPCPICLVPLSTIFAEEEKEVEQVTAGAEDEEDKERLAGVTKLEGCGHVFCRRDLTEWIRSQHGSCPTCRHTFLNIRPLSESDDESSDGGEYIPTADDFEDEDEDAFLDVDGFTDTDADDFPVENMDLDFDEIWEDDAASTDHAGLAVELGEDADAEMTDVGDDGFEEADHSSEWGLTDGESESMSSSEAGDMTVEEGGAAGAAAANVPEREVSVSVHEDEDVNAKEGEGIDAAASASELADSQQDKDITNP